eukprot:Sspe_Gene.82165::Locus_53810_Transcript_1_1_Confidence_1.000_Length_1036::g.82165::m.82165
MADHDGYGDCDIVGSATQEGLRRRNRPAWIAETEDVYPLLQYKGRSSMRVPLSCRRSSVALSPPPPHSPPALPPPAPPPAPEDRHPSEASTGSRSPCTSTPPPSSPLPHTPPPPRTLPASRTPSPPAHPEPPALNTTPPRSASPPSTPPTSPAKAAADTKDLPDPPSATVLWGTPPAPLSHSLPAYPPDTLVPRLHHVASTPPRPHTAPLPSFDAAREHISHIQALLRRRQPRLPPAVPHWGVGVAIVAVGVVLLVLLRPQASVEGALLLLIGSILGCGGTISTLAAKQM